MKFRTNLFWVAALYIACSFSQVFAQIQLSYDQQVANFGHLGIDYTVRHTYKIPNNGKTPIKLTKLEINCDCTTAQILDSTIKPGDTGRIRVTFNTKDYYGPTNKSFKVFTNNPQTPSFDLYYVSVIGQWFDGLKPNPLSLFFLPGKPAQLLEIFSGMHDLAEVDSVINEDTLFTVTSKVIKAGKNEKLVFEVTPNANLTKGTFLGNFSVYIRFDQDDKAEPMILTTPVKIVRF